MVKLMLADDEAVITTQLERRLSTMGYDVVGTASSGEESIELARKLKPALILMDIVMPGRLDGIDAAEIIRNELDIPIIFLTAYADDKFIKRAKIVEPFGYIVKPFKEKEIKATIEITLYKQKMEMKLKENEDKFRKISDTANDAIIMLDNNNCVTYWNKAAEKMFGYSLEEVIGKKIHETIVPDRFREDHIKGFNAFRDTGQGPIIGKTIELAALRKDGTEFLTDHSFSSVIIKDKWAAVCIIRNITDRKQAELNLKMAYNELEDKVAGQTKELSEANVRLEGLDRLKSMFISSMSHELITPLNSIIGFTGIILQGIDGEINPQQKDHLGRANKSAKHLLALIIDIIDISKIEAGKIEAIMEEFNLDEVVNEAVESVRPQTKEKGLALEVSVTPGVQINTDKKRVMQCILNFLSNAVKFTEAGSITVVARKIDEEIEITVSDTGIGISEQDQVKMFKPFVRLDSHLRTLRLGTGLGLYLTKKLATELLGGTVDVQSQPGKGSTFTLRLLRELKQG